MEFQFGMNWSAFSAYVGDIFGSPLAIEGLGAFMLEATFIGLWFFGWTGSPRGAPRDHLPRLGRHVALCLLHPRGQLLDAAPGRLRNQLPDRPGGGHGHLQDPLPGLRALRLGACHLRRIDDRRLPRPRRGLLAPSARSKRRDVPQRGRLAIIVVLPVSAVAAVVRQPLRHLRHRRPADEDRATEALWDTEQPAGFSLFQIGGFTRATRHRRRHRDPGCSRSGDGFVQRQGRRHKPAPVPGRAAGRGTTSPTFASSTGACVSWPIWGLCPFCCNALGRRSSGGRSWGARSGSSGRSARFAFPFLSNFPAGSSPRPGGSHGCGLLKTEDAVSGSVSAWTVGLSLGLFVSLYTVLGLVDLYLMRRYARLDPPEVGGEGEEGRRNRRQPIEMTLEALWFCLLCVLWTGYFITEGFDFGVGMLLPVLGRRRKSDGRCSSRSAGLGRKGVARHRRRGNFAAFPCWYAPGDSLYLSSSCSSLMDILRVPRFEWPRTHSPRWRCSGPGSTQSARSALHGLGDRPRRWCPIASRDLCRELRRPLQRLHDPCRDRRPALRAPRRGLPHAPHARRQPRASPPRSRAPRAGDRARGAASSSGRSSSQTTETTKASSPASSGRGRAVAAVAASSWQGARRAFGATALTIVAVVVTSS